MAFTNPKNWQHRNALTHTDLNVLVSNHTHLRSVLGGFAIANSGRRQPFAGDTVFVLQHFRRYLFVDGAEQEAKITSWEDPENEKHDLGVTSGIGTFIDLATISWLIPGRLYRVVDCHHAVETDYI